MRETEVESRAQLRASSGLLAQGTSSINFLTGTAAPFALTGVLRTLGHVEALAPRNGILVPPTYRKS